MRFLICLFADDEKGWDVAGLILKNCPVEVCPVVPYGIFKQFDCFKRDGGLHLVKTCNDACRDRTLYVEFMMCRYRRNDSSIGVEDFQHGIS